MNRGSWNACCGTAASSDVDDVGLMVAAIAEGYLPFSTGEIINAISACVQNRMTAEDIAMFQTGTHPALTASPIAYHMVNAAEMAIQQIRESGGQQ